MSNKTYLGDGVYIEYLYEAETHLTTENGIEVTNRIVLEPEVIEALIRWLKK